jgi:hypothetical protein
MIISLDLGEHFAAVGAGQVEIEQDDAGPIGSVSSAILAAVIEIIERVVTVAAANDGVSKA